MLTTRLKTLLEDPTRKTLAIAAGATLLLGAAGTTPDHRYMSVAAAERAESRAAIPAPPVEVPADVAAPEPVLVEVPAPVAPPPPPEPTVPLDIMHVTNPFGWREGVNPLLPAGTPELHNGIDFGADTGTPVLAVKPGTVTYAEYHQYGGLRTIIDHGDGTESTYSHQNEQWVHPGDHVELGQPIGTVGTTGNSTGPHLHFEFWENGVEVDPAPRFDSF